MVLSKSGLATLLCNLRGWRTSRKFIIFESDDWGAVRMSGPKAWRKLVDAGIRVDRSRYDSLDCLETTEDFEQLMNVLSQHRDTSGRSPVFTLNTIMGNPDFNAIENDRFEQFHHQELFDSYRHYHDEDLEPTWRRSMAEGLIRPQFHGREHLNVPLWMRDLQSDHQETRFAFSQCFYGLTTQTSSSRQVNYLAAFWPESSADLESGRNRLIEGLALFQATFGFGSKTFIPCNYVFPEELEPVLSTRGVGLVQGQRGQLVPTFDGSGRKIRRSFTGQRSPMGLLYSVRNVMFEPFESESTDWVALALHQIAQSFTLRKPAVISSHRVNYVAGMSERHRNRSLRMLDKLLSSIRERWPDVEFISSDRLLNEMLMS